MKEEISRLACLREIVTELVAAMREYEMDVDEDPPYLHRQMMERASAVIANPATAPEPAPLPHEAARCDDAEREYHRSVIRLARVIDADPCPARNALKEEPEQDAEVDTLKVTVADWVSLLAERSTLVSQRDTCRQSLKEVEAENARLKDGIYSMAVGPEEQARAIDPVQWLQTRLMHVEAHNAAVDRLNVNKANLALVVEVMLDKAAECPHRHPTYGCPAENAVPLERDPAADRSAPEPAPLPHDAARCDEAEREYCRAVNGLDRAIDAAQNGGSNVCGMG